MTRFSEVVVHQHRRLIGLLDRIEESPESEKVRALADEIVGHTLAEEELLDRENSARDVEEHALLRYALQRLLVARSKSPAFEARLRMLRELLVHHCELEERARLPLVERALGGRRSRALAEKLVARFAELVSRGHRAAALSRP